ncbi:MAG: metallophosphoesterase [Saccharofermentans sp.]|nr:metallophosphoesterase [Saccharofermentans sp.]
MIYVISDLHGYPLDKLQKLLKKANFGPRDFLYILGDVVDRNGDGGVSILEWLLYQTNVQLILGNHEAMLLGCEFAFEEIKEDFEETMTPERMDMLQRYMADGGDVTLKAMQKLPKDTQAEILDYLHDCPIYEEVKVNGQEMILLHSGIDNFDPNKRIEDYSVEDLLWAWPELSDVYYKNILTVFGHTPTFSYGDEYKDKIIKTPTWIDIDMGAGFGREPVLLRLDDFMEFRLS